MAGFRLPAPLPAPQFAGGPRGSTWYDPQEIRDQADDAQLQPEFAIDSQTALLPDRGLPPLDREHDTAGYAATVRTAALVAGIQRIRDIIEDEITNDGYGASAGIGPFDEGFGSGFGA